MGAPYQGEGDGSRKENCRVNPSCAAHRGVTFSKTVHPSGAPASQAYVKSKYGNARMSEVQSPYRVYGSQRGLTPRLSL